MTTSAVSHPWAMQIPLSAARAAGLLRHHPGVRALVDDPFLWLRGEQNEDALQALLRQIPGERFTLNDAGTLQPPGTLLPVRPLPSGAWLPLADVLSVQAPASALSATPPEKITFSLVTATHETPANVLIAPRAAWRAWTESAPAIRLGALRFALSEDRAAIRGHPLPNLPGERLVECAGVAIPAGTQLDPPLPPEVLARILNLNPGDLALLHRDGAYELLPAEVFVDATRAAVRASEHAPAPSGGDL